MIELMIVIAIIAVIAAIAIPNLLQATISSNETTAITNLRQVATGQSMFIRSDWYGINTSSNAVWAPHLYEFTASSGDLKQPHFMDRAMADSFGTDLAGAGAIPKAGYLYHDINLDAQVTPLAPGDPVVLTFAYEAVPAGYEQTGRSTLDRKSVV